MSKDDKLSSKSRVSFTARLDFTRRSSTRSSRSTTRIDEIIDQLFSVKGNEQFHDASHVDLNLGDVFHLCKQTKKVLLKDPVFLHVTAPVKVVGNLHGQFTDLLLWFTHAGSPPEERFLFLGDYVDKGPHGIETITLLFALKVKYPNQIYLLRGDHESVKLNMTDGFYAECERRYSIKLWRSFIDCFNCLPVAALVNRKIFCVHGGLSPLLNNPEELETIVRPTDIPDTGLLCDILWSEPAGRNFIGWGPSPRGVSHVFGANIVNEFITKNKLLMICRAHQVVADGYEFFANRNLVTLFSAPNYAGEFNNTGAVLIIGEDLVCSFITLMVS